MESTWRNFDGHAISDKKRRPGRHLKNDQAWHDRHLNMSKEEVLELRREQNREAARRYYTRRCRKKTAQQRAFLEEMQSVRTQIAGTEDDSVLEQLKERLQNLEGIAAVHNRSSQSKVEHC